MHISAFRKLLSHTLAGETWPMLEMPEIQLAVQQYFSFTSCWRYNEKYMVFFVCSHVHEQAYKLCSSNATCSQTQWARETSPKAFYEKASTFLPNDPVHTAVCRGKEPLREESLIIGTQCPEGCLQFKTYPFVSAHTTLSAFPHHCPDCMRNCLW